jgi:serine/threonine protein phosphatase PrpC
MTYRLESAAASRTGRARTNNEDFAAVARVASVSGEPFSVWLVADGVGGGPQGEDASRAAVDAVVAHLSGASWSDPSTALAEAYGLAGDRVFGLTANGSAATTLVAALASEVDGRVWIANVGDSRAYLVARGAMRILTEDHSMAAEAVAAGRMTRETARTAAERHVLTRALGATPEVDVDVFGPWRLGPGARVVLCTDGVYGVVDEPTIYELASLPVGEAADRLVEAAIRAGGRDDATVCVGGLR